MGKRIAFVSNDTSPKGVRRSWTNTTSSEVKRSNALRAWKKKKKQKKNKKKKKKTPECQNLPDLRGCEECNPTQAGLTGKVGCLRRCVPSKNRIGKGGGLLTAPKGAWGGKLAKTTVLLNNRKQKNGKSRRKKDAWQELGNVIPKG